MALQTRSKPLQLVYLSLAFLGLLAALALAAAWHW
jgi:hypothetical protein